MKFASLFVSATHLYTTLSVPPLAFRSAAANAPGSSSLRNGNGLASARRPRFLLNVVHDVPVARQPARLSHESYARRPRGVRDDPSSGGVTPASRRVRRASVARRASRRSIGRIERRRRPSSATRIASRCARGATRGARDAPNKNTGREGSLRASTRVMVREARAGGGRARPRCEVWLRDGTRRRAASEVKRRKGAKRKEMRRLIEMRRDAMRCDANDHAGARGGKASSSARADGGRGRRRTWREARRGRRRARPRRARRRWRGNRRRRWGRRAWIGGVRRRCVVVDGPFGRCRRRRSDPS